MELNASQRNGQTVFSQPRVADADAARSQAVSSCLPRWEGKKKKGQKYSKEFRDFAVTLFYYSPRAYKYVAKLFSMPNVRTIRRWITAVDALPGIFLCMSFHLKCFQYSYELGNKVIFLLPAVQLIGGVAQVARRQVLNARGGDCDGMDSDASQSSLAFHTKLQHI